VREIQQFGAFRLDRRRRRLERTGGETVELGTKPFDALVFLVEHAGEPVSRKALIDALWPDTVVEENNLTQVVSALRRVLGEGYIVTLSGRGYQFVGDVRSAGRDSLRADAPGTGAAPPSIDRRIADRNGRQHSPEEETVSAENALGPQRAGTLAKPRVQVAARCTVGRERELAEAEMVSRPFWRRAPPVSDPQAAATPPARPISRLMLPLTAGLIIGALVVGSLAWILIPESSPATIKRFAHPISERIADDSAQRGRSLVALAPDGRSFVYRAADRLYLRPIGQLEARPIPGTEESPLNPFFSPDGQSVAYFAGGALKRIALSGGIPVPIASGVSAPFGASWDSNGTILFGQPQGIFRVSADGGKPELVIRAEQGERLYGPEFLPDGDSVLFSATMRTWSDAQIVVQSLSTGDRTPLVEGGSDAHYVTTGHLVYAEFCAPQPTRRLRRTTVSRQMAR
jgi:DNA-binding winged helix-turn-helix (wHTH) protein